MKKGLLYIIIGVLVAACGNSYEEQKRLTRAERIRLAKEDSMALKVGVLSTLDCLPVFVAKDRHFFDTLGVDVRLRQLPGQIDCDEALQKGSIEGAVTDLVRAQRLKRRGTALRYVASTNAYWQFITNRRSRISELKQMSDKMVAMSRFSVTDLLSDLAADSARLNTEYMFRVQINDPNIRLKMLLNNEIDAMLSTEPQATAARLMKNPVLMDSRDKDIRMGVFAFREKALKDKNRQEQLSLFLKGYDMACDSINQYGLQHYEAIISKYTKADKRTIEQLPKILFDHATTPRQKDIDRADRWLK